MQGTSIQSINIIIIHIQSINIIIIYILVSL